MALFEKAFALGTGVYVLAFGVAVYATTESGAAKLGVSLLICALPVLLSAEVSGGDAAAGAELASTWREAARSSSGPSPAPARVAELASREFAATCEQAFEQLDADKSGVLEPQEAVPPIIEMYV